MKNGFELERNYKRENKECVLSVRVIKKMSLNLK